MKNYRRVIIPKNKTYGYEIWLLQNGFTNIKIRCFSNFSVIDFFDEQEFLMFKLKGVPDIVSTYDAPDLKFISRLRKTLDLYSDSEPTDLTITIAK